MNVGEVVLGEERTGGRARQSLIATCDCRSGGNAEQRHGHSVHSVTSDPLLFARYPEARARSSFPIIITSHPPREKEMKSIV
jgi:hypothetical protein